MKTWKDDLGKRFVFQTPRRYAATICACTVFFVRRVKNSHRTCGHFLSFSEIVSLFFRFSFACV